MRNWISSITRISECEWTLRFWYVVIQELMIRFPLPDYQWSTKTFFCDSLFTSFTACTCICQWRISFTRIRHETNDSSSSDFMSHILIRWYENNKLPFMTTSGKEEHFFDAWTWTQVGTQHQRNQRKWNWIQKKSNKTCMECLRSKLSAVLFSVGKEVWNKSLLIPRD